MRLHPVIPLLALAAVLTPTVLAVHAQSGLSGDEPAAVVDSFFRDIRQERWRDAARFMDLGAFSSLRDQTVRNFRRPAPARHATPEDFMKFDPGMPRAVAEYQAERANLPIKLDDWLMHDYARVANVDTLASLSVEEAAARWLEAKDPRYRLSVSLAAERNRCDLPDSVITQSVHVPTITARVLGTVRADSLAYVLYTEAPVGENAPDSPSTRRPSHEHEERAYWTMPPSVMTLRRVGDHWRIAPGEPFGGLSSYVTLIECPTLDSGTSPAREPR